MIGMDGEGRNCRAFWSDRLKNNPFSQDRFNDLERAEVANRLDRLADVRSSVVARGKALIANPRYPEPIVLKKISELLAGRLG